jgi:decaprenylphospho-beta-D-ribofuranose 2-oxidase
VARGLGRSYGDPAQNAGGEVVVTTGLDRILALDVAGGRARVESGVSFDALIRAVLPF